MDEAKGLYPNTPAPWPTEQSGMALTSEKGIVYDKSPAGYDKIELPRQKIYSTAIEIDDVLLKDVPYFLRGKVEDSFRRSGSATLATLEHYIAACHGAGVFDDGTVKALKGLTADFKKAQTHPEQKAVLEGKIYPFLRSITIKDTIRRR